MEQADLELERIGGLLPGAIEAGLSLVEISRLAGVSRPTLYQLQERSNGVRNPDLEVLAALVGAGPQTEGELEESFGWSTGRLGETIDRLIEKRWIEKLDGPGRTSFAASRAGADALARWDLSERFEERTTKTLRVMLNLMRFSPAERADVERKVARAEAQGMEVLGLIDALRMGMDSERKRLRRKLDDAMDGEREVQRRSKTPARIIRFPGAEPWLTKRQIAAYDGRSTRWVELRVREGLPSSMIGGRRGFKLSAVEEWVAGRYA